MGPVVEAPRTDAPRLAVGPPAVEVDAGAVVLVVADCDVAVVVVVVAEAGLSGTLKGLLKGALVVAVAEVDEVGV